MPLIFRHWFWGIGGIYAWPEPDFRVTKTSRYSPSNPRLRSRTTYDTVGLPHQLPQPHLEVVAVVPGDQLAIGGARVAVVQRVAQVGDDAVVVEPRPLQRDLEPFVLGRGEHVRAPRLQHPHDLAHGFVGLKHVLQRRPV